MKTSEESKVSLRELVVAEMQRHEKMRQRDYPGTFYRERDAMYCTWWFKERIKFSTIQVRAELLKMKKEGLVTADISQSNNTKWLLVEPVAIQEAR
ncbi:hypothetical protein [Undibacterium sp. TJN19]|uniref:hypothetical protein n=1 Tax=Undibacterium sp. TJN19 TaxID=3413055 RepID=UPI003BF21E5F